MQHIKLSKAINYCIRIDKGQDIIQTIVAFCNINKITSACFSGIGATNDATVAVYNTKTKKYVDTEIKDDSEILSLNGNVSLFENKPFVHAHVVLGLNNNNVVGGHVKQCVVSITSEIFLHAFKNKINRSLDVSLGINTLHFN